jgi:hypothetical protein
MLHLYACATLDNPEPITRNEQESGSSPLVGSLFLSICRRNWEEEKGLFAASNLACLASGASLVASADIFYEPKRLAVFVDGPPTIRITLPLPTRRNVGD